MDDRFAITLGEFIDLETTVGLLDTDGSEEFVLSRFKDGELGLKVISGGEESNACRLGDWAQGVAAQRER